MNMDKNLRDSELYEEKFRFKEENPENRDKVQEVWLEDGKWNVSWRPVRPIPADDDFIDFDEIRKELDEVRNDLIYNSSAMSEEERKCLKLRKEELKSLLKKEGNNNGR